MSQQHEQQVKVLQGKEADRPPEQPDCSSTADETATLKQPVSSVSSGTGIAGQKKKSSFEITSVTETKAHNRGDSNGYLEDELNEHDESDLLDVELEVETVDEKTNGNGGSRFKVVRIQRNAHYSRGRWVCHDFQDSEPSSSTSISTAPSGSNIGIQSQKDNSDRPDLTNVSSSINSHLISNHLPFETSTRTDLSARATPPLDANSKTSLTEAHSAVDSSRRKDLLEPRARGADKTDTFNSHRTASESTVDRTSERTLDATRSAEAVPGTVDPELPIVNTIATAMDQITQIKSQLLSVVHEEVQTLKETISKLKEENIELKQENQKLRQRVKEDPV